VLVPLAAQCRVTDPTNTPLNVRKGPYDRMVSAFENGTLVSVLETTTDARGRQWDYVDR
jgi:hypothetical protein